MNAKPNAEGGGDADDGGARRPDTDAQGAALIETLARLSPAQRMIVLNGLTVGQTTELQERWYGWAHAGQIAPPGDWRVWLIRAGRGFGKTRAGAEWVSEWARSDGHARIALVGATADDVAKVMIEGPSGVIAVARSGETVTWRPSAGEVTFHSGAKGFVYSAEAPDKLRGPEHHAACRAGTEGNLA